MATVNKIRVIDCDTHFWQPYALWERFVDAEYRDAVATSLQTALERSPIPKQSMDGVRGEGHRGGDHVDARLEFMDAEGIDTCVIYPSFMALLPCLPDPEVASAAARGLNRWSADFASAAPRRLKPCMVLPFYHPSRVLEEFEYASRELDLRVAFCPPTPSFDRAWSDSEMDPLWQSMQEAQVPLTFHEFTRFPDGSSNLVARSYYQKSFIMMGLCSRVVEMQLTLMDLILGGVLDRFPKLRVGMAEANVAWLPAWLALLDDKWENARTRGVESRKGLIDFTRSPSDQFRRQGFVVAFPDDLWLEETIKYLGPDNVMIGSDFPHPATRPNMVRTFDAANGSLSQEVRRKILSENAVRVYGF